MLITMSDTNDHLDLTGKILIAMPGMGDPRFEKSVVFMCAHSDDGAMGLIVNKPLPDLEFADLLAQLEIDPPKDADQTKSDIRVHFGGPVENGRGFVLHSGEYRQKDATLEVEDGFGMTTSRDILKDIAQGSGPDDAFLALGYSGWGPGQLEDEIRQNGWLTAEASSDLVFKSDNEGKWGLALKSLGIDPLTLSATAGRA